MRNFKSIILVVFMLYGCKSDKEKIQNKNDLININYLNKINGYNVSIIWKPKIIYLDYAIGPAMIEFNSLEDSISFTIVNNNFGLLKSNINFDYSKDSLKIKKINVNNLQLEYKENFANDAKLDSYDNPFFFKDVDFDNSKELIVSEPFNGQRGWTTYKVYKLDGRDITPSLYDITFDEPFKSLDNMSKINYKDRTITIFSSGGACSSSYDIYELVPKEDEEEATRINLTYSIKVEQDEKTQKCYEIVYKVKDREEYLISKEELND